MRIKTKYLNDDAAADHHGSGKDDANDNGDNADDK